MSDLKLIEHFHANRLAIIFAVLFVAALLRFVGLGAEPLWIDEGYSLYFSRETWLHLWQELPQYENHPPLYFMILKAWTSLAGESEAALRFPSAVFSFCTVLCLFASGRIVGRAAGGEGKRGADLSWELGTIGAILCAFAQLQIAYADEARPYTLSGFGVALMMTGALGIIGNREPTRPAGILAASLALTFGLAVTIWSHILGLVPAGFTGLFLIGWWYWRAGASTAVFLRLVLILVAVVALCWPHFLNVLPQLTRDYSAFWLVEPPLLRLAKMTVQATGQPGLFGTIFAGFAATALFLALGLVGYIRLAKNSVPVALAFGYLLLISAGFWLVMVGYTYLSQPVILARTLIFMQPPTLLIMAAAPLAFPGRREILASAVVAVTVIGSLGPHGILAFERPYKDIVATISMSDAPDAPVLVMPGAVEVPLRYYEERLDVDLDLRPIPGPFPHVVDGRPEMIVRPEIDQARAAEIIDGLSDASVVWMVARLAPLYDPKTLLPAAFAGAGLAATIVPVDPSERPVVVVTRFDRNFEATAR